MSVCTALNDLIHFRQLRSMWIYWTMAVTWKAPRGVRWCQLALDEQRTQPRVHQLSGFGDPVCAEAFVTVHDCDIVLEILVVLTAPPNPFESEGGTLHHGGHAIVERPQSHTIDPLDQITIFASIKVSSTETGYIFGTIVYKDTLTLISSFILWERGCDLLLNVTEPFLPLFEWCSSLIQSILVRTMTQARKILLCVCLQWCDR